MKFIFIWIFHSSRYVKFDYNTKAGSAGTVGRFVEASFTVRTPVPSNDS
jgi:hypothetical protein